MEILRRFRSIRFILTFWYSLILSAAIVLFGAAVYLYLKRVQEAALEQDLLEEVDWISRLVDVDRKRIALRSGLEALSDDVERRITEHFVVNPRNYIVILSSFEGRMLFESGNRHDRSFVSGEIPLGETVVLTAHDTGEPRCAWLPGVTTRS